MRALTVLGGSAAFPMPGQACSGFLVEWDGFRLVLDLGYGTLPQLLAHVPDADLDAVVITHEHPDHCLDLHGLFRIRHYGSGFPNRLPVYCPPGVLERLASIEPDVDLHSAFEVHSLPGRYEVGPFGLSSLELPHFVPTVGIRLDNQAVSIAYTGDTGPDPLLADLGRDVDLYIVEATDRPGETERATRKLLTAAEAGQWAGQAGAKRLLLTHLWPGHDPRTAVLAAERSFAGPVQVAQQGLRIELDTEEAP